LTEILEIQDISFPLSSSFSLLLQTLKDGQKQNKLHRETRRGWEWDTS